MDGSRSLPLIVWPDPLDGPPDLPDHLRVTYELVLALASAMVAGAYPAWRICRIQPGAYLKAQ